MTKKLGAKVLIYTFIAIIMFIYLFPLFYALNTSFKTKLEYMSDPISIAKSIHFENYVEAFKKANISAYIGNSVFYMLVCTTASMLMATFLAFPLSRGYLKFGSIIFGLFLVSMFLPDGTIPQFQLLLRLGLYNTRLGYMIGMIGGGGTPLLMFYVYIKGIPKEFDEAASIDGCGYFRYMFTILIPLMKPALVSMFIITAIGVWNDIIRAIIYLSSKELYPITRGLYVFQGQYQVDMTQQMAALIMVAAPLIIAYVFLQRYIVDGIVAGAVKA
ncbi:MAG: carbohydrate ABC transporter permease [Clostridiaceae bacterium]|nr:carbohydrate ABC transporter permease [Clostridiaceae bacterium]